MARERRKVRVGVVIRKKTAKTAIVAVEVFSRHPLYGKLIRKVRKYMVHDKDDRARVGDVVRIEECRPLSARKRWRIVEFITHEEVPETAPEEVERAEGLTPQGEPGGEETASQEAGR